MEGPQRWEYRVQSAGSTFKTPKDEEIQEALNELGAEGWEIIAVHYSENTGKIRILAKRALSGAPRRSRGWPE